MKLRQARKIAAQSTGHSRYDHYCNKYWLYRWFDYEDADYTHHRDHRLTKAMWLLRRFRREEFNDQLFFKLLGIKR